MNFSSYVHPFVSLYSRFHYIQNILLFLHSRTYEVYFFSLWLTHQIPLYFLAHLAGRRILILPQAILVLTGVYFMFIFLLIIYDSFSSPV